MDQTKYVPGGCNIGNEEVAWRKTAFYTGLFATIAFAVYYLFEINNINLCLLFFVSTFTAINFQQYRNRFCIRYGWFNQFNFEKRGMKQNLFDEEKKKVDRKKVIEIMIKSILFAAVFVVLVYFLSLLFGKNI